MTDEEAAAVSRMYCELAVARIQVQSALDTIRRLRAEAYERDFYGELTARLASGAVKVSHVAPALRSDIEAEEELHRHTLETQRKRRC